jgi:hypothetical protein
LEEWLDYRSLAILFFVSEWTSQQNTHYRQMFPVTILALLSCSTLGMIGEYFQYPWRALTSLHILDTGPKTTFLAYYGRCQNGQIRTIDPKVKSSSPFGFVFLNPYELRTHRDFFVPSLDFARDGEGFD